jgi:hypothetical protein
VDAGDPAAEIGHGADQRRPGFDLTFGIEHLSWQEHTPVTWKCCADSQPQLEIVDPS